MLIRVPLIQMFYFPFHVAECCFCMCVGNELSSKFPLFKCMNCLVVGKVYQAVIQLRSNVKCFFVVVLFILIFYSSVGAFLLFCVWVFCTMSLVFFVCCYCLHFAVRSAFV